MCRAIPENFSIFLVFAQKSYPPGGFWGTSTYMVHCATLFSILSWHAITSDTEHDLSLDLQIL